MPTHAEMDEMAGRALAEAVLDHLKERAAQTETDLRQAIWLGTEMAECEALFMLAMKARQTRAAELDRRRPRLVWDRDRGTSE